MVEQRRTQRTFATVFDEALAASGTSVTSLRGRLAGRGHRVAASTLGYWRNGQRQPERADSLDAVAEIEAILRLRPGTLTGAIGASRRSGPPIAQAAVDELPSMSPASQTAQPALRMSAATDGVFRDNDAAQMAAMTPRLEGGPDRGYAGDITVRI